MSKFHTHAMCLKYKWRTINYWWIVTEKSSAVQAWVFFQALISQLLKFCLLLRWSIINSYLFLRFKYMIPHIHEFICIIAHVKWQQGKLQWKEEFRVLFFEMLEIPCWNHDFVQIAFKSSTLYIILYLHFLSW